MQLETSSLGVTVLPEVGGKVARIIDKRTNRSLLVPSQAEYQTVPFGDSWLNHDKSGMDDCFPNVAGGPHPNRGFESLVLPDLGEWVYGTWEVMSGSQQEITLQKRGMNFAYRATKRICFLGHETLKFEYTVVHCGDTPFRYMWSAHPLFVVDDVFAIRLPGVLLWYKSFPLDGQVRRWPAHHNTDLSSKWIPYGTTLKIFVSGLDEGWCELLLQHQVVRLAFDLNITPFVGIWFNNFGFPKESPYRCIALEPCTSASDVLDASDASEDAILNPGGKAQWWLTLQASVLER